VETKRKVEQEGSRTEQKEYNSMQEVSAEADKSPSDISSWPMGIGAKGANAISESHKQWFGVERCTRYCIILVSAILPSNVWWRGCA